jgi:hypothetical protein
MPIEITLPRQGWTMEEAAYSDFIVKLSALTLLEHPAINARWKARRHG